jgi:uncharacterized damage-inducible protein DinB
MLNPYLIGDLAGFAPQIGRLVGMMEYARRTTLAAVEGLDREQLDHLHDPHSNSIGALLAHIAAVELAYQLGTLAGRGLTEAESRRWGPALQLGATGRALIRGYDLAHYLEQLAEVRGVTLAELASRDDDWLNEQTPFWKGLPANNYFKWFHVFEDELNHRGQIRWLRARLPAR